jgi:hypothetical protein
MLNFLACAIVLDNCALKLGSGLPPSEMYNCNINWQQRCYFLKHSYAQLFFYTNTKIKKNYFSLMKPFQILNSKNIPNNLQVTMNNIFTIRMKRIHYTYNVKHVIYLNRKIIDSM